MSWAAKFSVWGRCLWLYTSLSHSCNGTGPSFCHLETLIKPEKSLNCSSYVQQIPSVHTHGWCPPSICRLTDSSGGINHKQNTFRSNRRTVLSIFTYFTRSLWSCLILKLKYSAVLICELCIISVLTSELWLYMDSGIGCIPQFYDGHWPGTDQWIFRAYERRALKGSRPRAWSCSSLWYHSSLVLTDWNASRTQEAVGVMVLSTWLCIQTQEAFLSQEAHAWGRDPESSSFCFPISRDPYFSVSMMKWDCSERKLPVTFHSHGTWRGSKDLAMLSGRRYSKSGLGG